MQQLFSKFLKTESGAVTVEWVVLSALAVTLLAAGYGSMRDGATTLADGTGSYMNDSRQKEGIKPYRFQVPDAEGLEHFRTRFAIDAERVKAIYRA